MRGREAPFADICAFELPRSQHGFHKPVKIAPEGALTCNCVPCQEIGAEWLDQPRARAAWTNWHKRFGHGHYVIERAHGMAEQPFQFAEGKGRAPGPGRWRGRGMAMLADRVTRLAQPVLQVDADLFRDFTQHSPYPASPSTRKGRKYANPLFPWAFSGQ